MADLNAEMVKASRLRIGSPFISHFKPNLCRYGLVTIDSCMERGMDASGYDCSGLVIASLCDVMGTKASDWPREYRHLRQLEALTTDAVDEDGDILFIESTRHDGRPHSMHCGIETGEHTMVHATSITRLVEESWADGIVNRIHVLKLEDLVQLVQS